MFWGLEFGIPQEVGEAVLSLKPHVSSPLFIIVFSGQS